MCNQPKRARRFAPKTTRTGCFRAENGNFKVVGVYVFTFSSMNMQKEQNYHLENKEKRPKTKSRFRSSGATEGIGGVQPPIWAVSNRRCGQRMGGVRKRCGHGIIRRSDIHTRDVGHAVPKPSYNINGIDYAFSPSASSARSAAGHRRRLSSKAIRVASERVYLRISRIRYLSCSVIKV